MKFILLTLLMIFLSAACGSDLDYPAAVASQSPPFLTQVDPANASAGETVTLYGLGFSVLASANVVLLGEAAVSAASYGLNDDTAIDAPEEITFVVPEGLNPGQQPLSLFVIQSADSGLTSNPLSFTVNP